MSEQIVAFEPAASVNWKLDGSFIFPEEVRASALNYLGENPFPTTRKEDWKYTRVTRIKNAQLSVQPISNVKQDFSILPDSIKCVFINGHFSKELSTHAHPHGLKALALSEMDNAELGMLAAVMTQEEGIFQAINSAYTTDGMYLHVSAGCEIEKTIEIVHITDGQQVLSNVRNTIVVEKSAKAHVVQRFVSTDGSGGFTNTITEISIAPNANVSMDKLQEESDTQFQVAREIVKQEADSVFTINTVTLRGALVRNDLRISVDGTNCETNLNGAYVLSGNQHVDNHTIVDHRMPHCQSNELYKGVIDENATAVFNGKVFVRKDAQKINAFQSNANVLMSDSATVNSKPELEIYADDVKCSHGSTTGQIDEEAIFYLRARGIGEASARKLMVAAFIGDVLSKIENEAVHDHVQEQLQMNFNWTI